MTIVKNLTASILGLALLTATGCDQKSTYVPPPAGGSGSDKGMVAVVDLDKIAKQMGWTDELTKSQSDLDKELSDQLNKYGESLRTEYSTKEKDFLAKEKKLSATSTDAEKAEVATEKDKLATTKAKLDEQFRAAFTRAQQQSQQNRVTLVVGYREKISPVALRVGAAKGFSLIMMKNEALLNYDSKNEITNEVINELQDLQKAGKLEKPASSGTPKAP